MTLPMDFSTALWWRSVPKWEWEPLPPSPESEPSQQRAESAPPASPASGEREGFRLVFKGYQVAATLFWYPADSPVSRPWLRAEESADGHRARTEDRDAAERAARLRRAETDDGAQPT